MLRNVASQKFRVYAWDATTGLPKTGDAANISAKITKDHGSAASTNDAAPTEVDSTNEKGYYEFDLTQAESDAFVVMLAPKSSTSNIVVIGCPPVIYTRPQYFTAQVIDSSGRVDVSKIAGTSQTARDIGASVLLAGGRVIPSGDVGDFPEDTTVVLRFNTVSTALAPITLAGTPVLSVYKDSITQRAGAEITLTVDYDSVTGLHHVSIDTSGDAFYEVGKNYTVVITTGTVSGVSVVGSVVGSFSIENRFQEVDVVKWLGTTAQGATGRPQVDVELIEGSDPSDTIRDAVVDDATRIDASALNTAAVTTIPAILDDTDLIDDGTSGLAKIASDVAAILVDTGTTLDGKVDSILTDTGTTLDGKIDAILTDTGTTLDGKIDAILTDTGTTLDGKIDAIKAITDLLTAANAEPTGVPAADAAPLVKLAWLFRVLRNKLEVTATAKTFYDDSGSADFKKVLSDDGTTYAEAEAVAP